jgi:hypothetical protein
LDFVVGFGVTVVYVPRRLPLRKIRSAGSFDDELLVDCIWTVDGEDIVEVNK